VELKEQTRLARCQDVASQGLGPGQDTVILSLTSGYLYTCSRTTAAFLDALDGCRTLAEVVDLLRGKFEVDRERLRQDVLSMGRKLLDERLVRVVG
jgi:hypothetical protein